MSDLPDIERALVARIAGALFAHLPRTTSDSEDGPLLTADGEVVLLADDATYAMGALQDSVLGFGARVYRGWAYPDTLDSDARAGAAHVTVFPEQGMTRNTTRYQEQWAEGAFVAPTLTVSVAGAVVTFGGAAGDWQLAGVACGAPPSQVSAAYLVSGTDTPESIATALAVQIAGARVSGAAVVLPDGRGVIGRVMAYQPGLLEVRRQQQGFRIGCWCPSPQRRDAVAGLVDVTMAPIRFLALADGSSARLVYRATYSMDPPGKAGIWRRDICVTAEYATTAQELLPRMLFGQQVMTGGLAAGWEFLS